MKETKIKIELTNDNYIKLKWKTDKEKEKIINDALEMYFNKTFCVREAEARSILWMGLLDK